MSARVLIFTAYHKPGLRLSDGGTCTPCKRFVTTIPRTPTQSKRAFTFTTHQQQPPQSSSRASADLPSCA